ncbi:glycoside hydrolase family 99-like domain-containing protein [Falsiroseomonas sp. HC035]|uniref:glycoside hydrolase family 99-like domain-containing protein n=1 Tax=Falsiroseomonas sp. HC035 TaxID=3390999 RepID=UPI003D31520F
MVPFDDQQAAVHTPAGLGRALSSIGAGEETLREPLRLKPFEHWVGHIPFAFWLISALRPRVLVELGTHRGNSFLAFCQAIEAERCGTRAYAVDTWEGDAHMGREEGLFEELSVYHDPRYGHFSSLVRSDFDQARALFPERSIDLLHIDGTHTYEAVRNDFETWEPTLSDRAVVLFHDTNVRRPDYGVWKLWEELSRDRPHFEFFHSFGLGVLAVGNDLPQPVLALLSASSDFAAATRLRSFFAARGLAGIERLAKQTEQERAGETARRHWAQIEAHNADHAAAQAALAAERARHEAEREAQRAQHAAALHEARQRLEEADRRARDLEAEHERLVKARRQDREQARQRTAEDNARLERVDGELRRALAALEAAQAQNQKSRRQAAELARAASAAIARLENDLARHVEDALSLRASTSWRLTTPLRTVGERMPRFMRPSLMQLARRARLLPAEPARVGEGAAFLPGIEDLTDLVAEPQAAGTVRRPDAAAPRMPRWPIQLPDLFALRGFVPGARIAVVAHVFYPELCDEMLEATTRLAEPFDLFVTLVEGHSEHLREDILRRFPHAHVWAFPNRGRDILPFMAIAATGALAQYALICKLHTKRSPHRKDGDVWRRHLVSGVLPDRAGSAALVAAFDNDPDLGMVVADGQIFNGEEHWGGNLQHLANLLPLLGYTVEQATRIPFAGGSIFWLRGSLLHDLLGLHVANESFEPEPIGTDGALAHAMERLFGIACHAAGMRLEQASLVAGPADAQPAGQGVGEAAAPPRVVAFYLPQFHPIPENDRWWGRGFTEWTNVTKAKPLFPGHRQPRLPGELGFTDLRLPETREAQADLARRHGISAFCYYYYWFGEGQRLLQRPLDEVLASGTPDFPFMICWANEPWSRNWDGANKEVLMPQDYREGWVEAFARDVAPLLRDRRYLRLGGPGGRPMLMVYRIMHVPRPAEAVAALREALRRRGVGEVHLAAGWLSLGEDKPLPDQPAALGLDSYFEFPPHRMPTVAASGALPEGMTGGLYEYGPTVDAALARLAQDSDGVDLHRAVMMGWDNTARRGDAAHVFRGATPGHFRRWLRGLVRHRRDSVGGEERLVFVNAWNEWAEGTCLEPDRDFGRGWLEAVRSALGVAPHPPGGHVSGQPRIPLDQ